MLGVVVPGVLECQEAGHPGREPFGRGDRDVVRAEIVGVDGPALLAGPRVHAPRPVAAAADQRGPGGGQRITLVVLPERVAGVHVHHRGQGFVARIGTVSRTAGGLGALLPVQNDGLVGGGHQLARQLALPRRMGPDLFPGHRVEHDQPAFAGHAVVDHHV